MDEHERDAVSRRRVVGGVRAEIAVAAAGPALAQGDAHPGAAQDGGRDSMEDPRSKYPKPPFRKQTQPWPGLARDTAPKPDHGEASYRGSRRLAGRKALVTVGDSGMGRAAAIAYACEGARQMLPQATHGDPLVFSRHGPQLFDAGPGGRPTTALPAAT
ncbi:MAG TPA: hypothetical protein VFA50_01200 [Stellaceae bacterium]|nr:hypothetical protein [Stellaceae bacterium]